SALIGDVGHSTRRRGVGPRGTVSIRSRPGQQKGPASRRGPSDESLSHGFSSGAKGIRTPDLFHAMEARYQLRHSPVSGAALRRLVDITPAWASDEIGALVV